MSGGLQKQKQYNLINQTVMSISYAVFKELFVYQQHSKSLICAVPVLNSVYRLAGTNINLYNYKND